MWQSNLNDSGLDYSGKDPVFFWPSGSVSYGSELTKLDKLTSLTEALTVLGRSFSRGRRADSSEHALTRCNNINNERLYIGLTFFLPALGVCNMYVQREPEKRDKCHFCRFYWYFVQLDTFWICLGPQHFRGKKRSSLVYLRLVLWSPPCYRTVCVPAVHRHIHRRAGHRNRHVRLHILYS